MKKTKKLTLIILISITLGLIMTHYLEDVQTHMLLSVRELLFFSAKSKVIDEDAIRLGSYKFSDEAQVNPVHVAQQVRSETSKLFNNEEITKKDIENIIIIADFLIDYKEEFEYEGIQYSMWPYNFDYPTYELKAPWYSGMAQGLGIEVLVAAYKLSDDDKYLHEARLAANSLYVPIDANGVAIYINNGNDGIWFEEYAKKNTEPPMVLNGHNFALIGLEKLLPYDSSYTELYHQGVKALEYKIPYFDEKVWSRYDLVKLMANPKYHRIHIDQLNYLGGKNDNEVLLSYADKFTYQKYIPLGATYRLIFYPHNSIVASLMINITIVLAGIILVKKARTVLNNKQNKGVNN